MNRLKLYLSDDDEGPRMPDGDYWVVETDSAYWIVSRDTACVIERALDRLWRPRWIVFQDLTGGSRRLRVRSIECVFESTAEQRALRRAFDRERQREEKADRRPWEED